MIRAVQTASNQTVYSLTRRGAIMLMVGVSVLATTLVLVVIALLGQHAQGQSLETLGHANRAVLVRQRHIISGQRAQIAQSRDAYCRLKHYETLSGDAVLSIAIRFHLLSPHAQRAWRSALRGVAEIPAAPSCSGVPVGVSRARAHGALHAVAARPPAPARSAPTVAAAPRRSVAQPRHSTRPASRAPAPAAAPQIPASTPTTTPSPAVAGPTSTSPAPPTPAPEGPHGQGPPEVLGTLLSHVPGLRLRKEV